MANRSKLYDPLRFIVQCRWPNKPFETIAAFNDFDVAHDYMKSAFERAQKSGIGFSYQTIERAKHGASTKVRSAYTYNGTRLDYAPSYQ